MNSIGAFIIFIGGGAVFMRLILKCFLILPFMAFLCLAGCGPKEGDTESLDKPNDTIVVGFAQLGAESSWRTSNTRSITKAAQEAGIQLMFSDAAQKQENQIKAIRSFIAYRVDVIAFAPIIQTGWENVLLEAKAAGIPVILTDREIEEGDKDLYACYIGSNFVTEGRMAGEYLKKKFEGTEKRVNIVELLGTVGSSPAEGRSKGFHDSIKESTVFQILCSESGDFMKSKGKEVMDRILKNYDNIDVLYSHNDSMALGAIEAVEAAGIVPGKDIVIISIDGEQGAIDALKEGRINCVVECDPMLGPTIMNTVRRIKRGEEIPKTIYTRDNVFTEWDDLSKLPPRGY